MQRPILKWSKKERVKPIDLLRHIRELDLYIDTLEIKETNTLPIECCALAIKGLPMDKAIQSMKSSLSPLERGQQGRLVVAYFNN